MNPNTEQDKPPNIVFQEYSKDTIAYFNGFGSIFHTIKATCKNTDKVAIEHRFGADESIVNPFFGSDASLKVANENLLTNKKRTEKCDFGFGLFGLKPAEFIGYEELPSLGNDKRFRINWESAFGQVKEAIYAWLSDKSGMFTISEGRKQHTSSLKVVYPTKTLIFRLIVNALYPIDGNPCIAVIDPKGEEILLMQASPVELRNEKLSFNYQSIQSSKCFKIEIKNPRLGFTYEMRWTSETFKLKHLIN